MLNGVVSLMSLCLAHVVLYCSVPVVSAVVGDLIWYVSIAYLFWLMLPICHEMTFVSRLTSLSVSVTSVPKLFVLIAGFTGVQPSLTFSETFAVVAPHPLL